jgi:hypothetical protein
MALALVLCLLAAAPADDARAALNAALMDAAANDAAKAYADFFRAFSLDPEIELPVDASPDVRATADRARTQAIAMLRKRLDEAASQVTTAFSNPPAPNVAAGSEQTRPEQPPREQVEAEEPPPPPPPPTLLKGRVGAALSMYSIWDDWRGGPALELSGGEQVGPVRLGGAVGILFGTAQSFTFAARVALVSPKRVSYRPALDIGVYYGTAQENFAGFLTAHVGTIRARAGPIWLEINLLSMTLYYIGNGTFRFSPAAGLGVVL